MILRGTPDDLVGVLELVNDTKEPLLVRSLSLRDPKFADLAARGRRRLTLRQSVPAGERRRVPVRFAVDPATPPGTYQVTFGDERMEHAAQLEVLPRQRLGLLPDRLDVEAAPGEVVKVLMVLTNYGNVPLELSVLAVAVLEEDQQVCLALQNALAAARGKDYEAFLNALTEDLAAKKVDFLRIRLAGSGLKLGVGATERAEVELHVPRNALPGRTYRSRAVAFDQSLFLRLRTRGGDAPR
jgi:hypothetical protein